MSTFCVVSLNVLWRLKSTMAISAKALFLLVTFLFSANIVLATVMVTVVTAGAV